MVQDKNILENVSISVNDNRFIKVKVSVSHGENVSHINIRTVGVVVIYVDVAILPRHFIRGFIIVDVIVFQRYEGMIGVAIHLIWFIVRVVVSPIIQKILNGFKGGKRFKFVE